MLRGVFEIALLWIEDCSKNIRRRKNNATNTEDKSRMSRTAKATKHMHGKDASSCVSRVPLSLPLVEPAQEK